MPHESLIFINATAMLLNYAIDCVRASGEYL